MMALTDDRVKFERAPFDHRRFAFLMDTRRRHSGVLMHDVTLPGEPVARDAWLLVPSVGRNGNTLPLQTFEEMLLGIGNDGSRAHAMTTPCPEGSIDSRRAVGLRRLGRQ
jgi:hypothetical protein